MRLVSLNIIFTMLLIVNVKNINAQVTSVRMYAFGHSLIDHRPPAIATPGDETTIMHWIYDIAQYKGNSFAAGGQYGFLTTHDNLPPISQWGYASQPIPVVWDDAVEPFSDANVNTVLVTAANFIQYVPPNAPHPLDNSSSVLQATETIFDWVNLQEPNVRYYIYGNWPEMNLASAFPPTLPLQTEIDNFHNSTISGSFNDWWKEYQDSMLISRPALNTRLIPAGMIISKIIKNVIPNQIPFDELYEDSAPHGRASLYFLAGMITYMAIYEDTIPSSYVPDTIVHSAIINNLPVIRNYIWNQLDSFNLSNGTSRVFFSNTTEVKNAVLKTDKISLYPNPTNGSFKIIGIKNKSKIEIVDVTGRIYKTINYDFSSKEINILNIPNGLYFIRVKDEQAQVLYVDKLIKSNF